MLMPDGKSLEIEVDAIDVTRAFEIDPDWREVDSNGHVHQYHFGKPLDYEDPESCEPALPTLIAIETVLGREESCIEYQCRFCFELVCPGLRPSKWRKYKPGLETYRLDGETVTKEEIMSLYPEVVHD